MKKHSLSSRQWLGVKILTAVITISFIFIGIYNVLKGPFFRVHNVIVEIEDSSSRDQMFAQISDALSIRLKPINGKLIWSLDLENLLEKVQTDIRIKSARVSRILPDKIRVTLVPHTPIAAIMSEQSAKVYPVSRTGDLLLPIPAEEMNEGPVMRGKIFLDEKEKRLKALEILLALPEMGIFSQSRVSEIYYDKKKGYHLYVAPTGIEVWLGFEDFERRISQSTRVIQYLEQEKMSGRIIDARFTKKVVVRLRNEP